MANLQGWSIIMKERKILFLITGLGMGGAEKQVCSLADKLADKKEKIIIVSLTNTINIVKPKNKNVRTICLSMRKTPFSMIQALINLKKICNIHKPTIIHSHMFHANILSRLLTLLYPHTILITTAHNSNEGGWLRMFIYRITDRLSTISTNVSKEAVESFIHKKAVKPHRMITMYNGIDTNLFTFSQSNRDSCRMEINIANDTPLLLSVGRLTEAKDYPNLLHAFSKLNHTPKPYLAIIGIGEEKDKLIQLAKELKVNDRIHWLGLRHDVDKWMSACDVFVLSSAWEGFGLVVAEAMACERLVIGTNSGGVQEVISDFGSVVSIKDSIALANSIDNYLALTISEKETLQKNARQHIINTFSLDKICSEWISLYEKSSNK